MSLINCPECNKEISDKAASCPHCGFPLLQEQPGSPSRKSNLLIAVLFIGSFLIIAAIVIVFAIKPHRREMNDYTYNIGIKALNAVDDALQGNTDPYKAHDILESYYYQLDGDDTGTSFVRTHILSCQVALTGWAYEKSNDNYEKLVEDRNDLASDLGERKINK